MRRPPRWARWLVAHSTPGDLRDAVLGDLEEGFHTRRDAGARAATWYAAQAIGFACVFSWERVRGNSTGGGRVADLIQDLRIATRSLARRSGFTAVAVGTLALGIGANTALFSVLYGSVLRTLPFPGADRLVFVSEGRTEGTWGSSQNAANARDIRRSARSLESTTIYTSGTVNVTSGDTPERLRSWRVTPELFTTLGLAPRIGRDFSAGENGPAAPPVTILSDALWKRRYGGDPGIIGGSIRIADEPVTVIGVADPAVELPGDPDLFLLHRWNEADLPRDTRNVYSISRLVDGTTVADADGEVKAIMAEIASEFPDLLDGLTGFVVPLRDVYVNPARAQQVWLLTGAAGLVLLIACVNVANLLLARAEVRHREIAVRTALGAGRGRIASLFLAESLLLSGGGALLGVILAYPLVASIVRFGVGSLPRSGAIGVTRATLAFACAAALATGLAVGLLPALRIRPTDPQGSLRDGGRGTAGAATGIRRALVVAEMALAVTLVAGAGLLLRSFQEVAAVDLGLDAPEQVLVASLSLPPATYAEPSVIAELFQSITADLEAIPGVRSAGVTTRMLLNGGTNFTSIASGDDPRREARAVEVRAVNDQFFAAAGIPIVAGRPLRSEDRDESAPGVVITRELARQLFPDRDPVGRQLDVPSWDVRPTIVGVAQDVRDLGPTRAVPPSFYLPMGSLFQPPFGILLVRAEGDPMALVPLLREAVGRADPLLPVFGIQTLDEVVAGSTGSRRFWLTLILLFGGLALVLGAVGIYGVMSYVVAQRTREMGVRLALGARATDVSRLVLGQGIRLTALGVGIGVAGALLSARLLTSMLFGVTPGDPWTHAGVALLLGAVALVATWVPARRAARTDPLEALRHE